MNVPEKPQYRQHKKLCDGLNDLYIQKNTAYGDSFHNTYVDLGIIAAVTRISDKFNRVKTLAKDRAAGTINVGDETIVDTLIDMANYCLLTVMEIQNEEQGK